MYTFEMMLDDVAAGRKPKRINFNFGKGAAFGTPLQTGWMHLYFNGEKVRSYHFASIDKRKEMARRWHIEAKHWCHRQRIANKIYDVYIKLEHDERL